MEIPILLFGTESGSTMANVGLGIRKKNEYNKILRSSSLFITITYYTMDGKLAILLKYSIVVKWGVRIKGRVCSKQSNFVSASLFLYSLIPSSTFLLFSSTR